MNYDIIGGDEFADEEDSFFTIQNLIDVCQEHSTLLVKFVETSYTVGILGSWRGSYDLPAITYEWGNYKPGHQIADELKTALKEKHYGYKGGEYTYYSAEEFYVSNHGSCEEYKVVKAVVEDGFLVLYTKKDPY